MTQPQKHEPIKVERTRTSATMVAVTVAVIFLVLLIIFIAQNNRSVPIHFLWMHGTVSEAIGLVVSAVAGAVLVLAVGLARIIQLRVGDRRHNKRVANAQKDAAQQPDPVSPSSVDNDSAVASPQSSSEPVQAKQ
jgi:uncharacterized integral membrane protein